jgi:iron-sulfur cluster repair protein YtfE (RIC family)
MKRDPALVSLSHDHHQVLWVAQTLRRTRADTVNEARAMFLTYWVEHGDPHFLHELAERLAEHVRLEERELFPMIERTIPAAHLLVVRERLERFEHPATRDRAAR